MEYGLVSGRNVVCLVGGSGFRFIVMLECGRLG